MTRATRRGEMPGGARVEFLGVAGSTEAWERLGFTVVDGVIWMLGTSIRLSGIASDEAAEDVVDERSETQGAVTSWVLSGVVDGAGVGSTLDIDGLMTIVAAPSPPHLVEHRNGALGLDHVVVMTGALERTSAALEAATGAPLKRIRDLGSMRQGFHRVGSGGLIVEIVERPEWGDQPAAFWGFVVDVADLETTVATLGAEVISEARDAVQPGRRIATVRRDAGLGVPLAFMSP